LRHDGSDRLRLVERRDHDEDVAASFRGQPGAAFGHRSAVDMKPAILLALPAFPDKADRTICADSGSSGALVDLCFWTCDSPWKGRRQNGLEANRDSGRRLQRRVDTRAGARPDPDRLSW